MKAYVIYRKVNGVTSPPLRAFEKATEWALDTMRAAALDNIHEHEMLKTPMSWGAADHSYTLASVEVFIRRLDVTPKGES